MLLQMLHMGCLKSAFNRCRQSSQAHTCDGPDSCLVVDHLELLEEDLQQRQHGFLQTIPMLVLVLVPVLVLGLLRVRKLVVLQSVSKKVKKLQRTI